MNLEDERKGQPATALVDPVTRTIISPDESAADSRHWSQQSRHWLDQVNDWQIEALCTNLYNFLDQQSRGEWGRRPRLPLCPHAPDSYLSDHALLTSAIAYCLGYEHKDVQWLRLAALSHELGEDVVKLLIDHLESAELGEFLWTAWQMLATQGQLLATQTGDTLTLFANTQPSSQDERLQLLWYAHLTASARLYNITLQGPEGIPIQTLAHKEDFDRHPLRQLPGAQFPQKIGLVHGGATKVKQYVFESAKLPEMRGGSVLLDHINQIASKRLVDAAPECVIFANGGEVLLVWPAVQAQTLADQIEQRYLQETLTAQAVVAANHYTLLELQYGVRPSEFWADEVQVQIATGTPEAKELLQSYYATPLKFASADSPVTSTEQTLYAFFSRKCFGELVTQLGNKRQWRRDGNEGSWLTNPALTARRLPFFETPPYGQFCTSCDERHAVVHVPDLADNLCEACARKRWVGWLMRRGQRQRATVFEQMTEWRPPQWAPPQRAPEKNSLESAAGKSWYQQFIDYLEVAPPHHKANYLGDQRNLAWEDIDPPDNLEHIGQAAQPKGYLGLVYADGNNVGALLRNIRSASAYRQFATRLFQATQAAVFNALARQLQPLKVQKTAGETNQQAGQEEKPYLHPFEIVSIGGDDLFLIVPADQALPIAQQIAATVETLFTDDESSYAERARKVQRYRPNQHVVAGKPQISISAGVVIAAEKTPILFLVDLVEELLKNAKTGASQRHQQGYLGSMVDFMALKSLAMVTSDVKTFRRAALEKEFTFDERNAGKAPRRETLHLTARPYTLHEIAGLLTTVTALKRIDFPRSQLYQLHDQLWQGRLVSSLAYLYFSSHLRGTNRLEKMAILRNHFDLAWCRPGQGAVPWQRRPALTQTAQELLLERDCSKESDRAEECQFISTEWETTLADIIELYDFVQEDNDE